MTKIRWGVLGCARIAERALIPALREAPGAELLGIAARDAGRAREWAERHGIPRAYRDYEALVADPDIDAVYIPLPNHLHAPWTMRAAAAGKHVLCEKPLALDEREAARMFRAAERAGVLLLEAFMYRFHPLFETALALAARGEIGDPRAVRSRFTFRISSGLEDYRWHPEMGGGALYDIGCYPINAARTLFAGEPLSLVARARFDAATGIDIGASLLLEFPGGRQALLDCAFDTAFQSELEIAGTEGRIFVPRAFSPKALSVTIELRKGEDVRAIPIPAANAYVGMIGHFQDALRDGRPLRYGRADARANARVLAAALRSAKSSRGVRWS